jgi:MFS family permease
VSEPSSARSWGVTDQPGLRRARSAVTVIFFLLGMEMASWASRLPAVKAGFHLSAGQLGLVLLGPAVGALVAMPGTGVLLSRVAPRQVTLVALVPLAGLLPMIPLAARPWQLFLILLGWGAAVGAVDVAVNTEAVQVQTWAGRRIMSTFHACYSIGGLVGAGVGALVAAYSVSLGRHLLVVGGVTLAVGVPAAWAFLRSVEEPVPSPDPPPPSGPVSPRRRRLPAFSWALVALAVVSFSSFLGEGAANDWSAVYLHTSLGASAGLAAVAYALFAGGMAIGRLAGDRLADRFGPARLVRTSASLGALGLGAALVVGHIDVALVGFAVLGLGLSFVVPLDFTAAADLGTVGPTLAAVTSSGYLGLLVGPPVIGGLAQLWGLPVALGLVVAICVVIATLAGVLGPSSRGRRAANPDRELAPTRL